MTPQPILIGIRPGTVVYLDDAWTPVEPAEATLAKVLFDDGGSAFYRVSALRAAGNENSGRYPRGSGKDPQTRRPFEAVTDLFTSESPDNRPREIEVEALHAAMTEEARDISSAYDKVLPMSDRRARVKIHVVDKIGDRLTVWSDRHSQTGAFDGPASAGRFVQEKLDQWADSSGDSHPASVAMQTAVKTEFGLTDAATEHMKVSSYFDGLSRTSATLDRAYVRAEYENTQAWFKKQGITHVSIYRGMGETEDMDEGIQNVVMQPASSWTTSYEIAYEFAGNRPRPMVIVARVPVERILSTAVTGRGCLNEEEVIVLGGLATVTGFRATHRATVQRNVEEYMRGQH